MLNHRIFHNSRNEIQETLVSFCQTHFQADQLSNLNILNYKNPVDGNHAHSQATNHRFSSILIPPRTIPVVGHFLRQVRSWKSSIEVPGNREISARLDFPEEMTLDRPSRRIDAIFSRSWIPCFANYGNAGAARVKPALKSGGTMAK